MNHHAWETHLEHLPDKLAALRTKNLSLHSRLAKAKRRAELASQQRDEAVKALSKATLELHRLHANKRPRKP
jgi:hypothetical protein